MCFFNQYNAITLLNGKLLKFVDYITFLSSNISSTESDVNISIGKVGKAWIATKRLTSQIR